MYIFIHEDKIMTIANSDATGKRIGKAIKGKGYKVIHANEILDPEDIWNLD